MDPRVFAVGDIHGCSSALGVLLDALDLQGGDTLITLGDYVDRGPDSKGVLELLLETANRCQLVPIFGNHEELMLSAVEDRGACETWLQCGGLSTLHSYDFCGDFSVIPQSHLDFLRGCLPYFETDTHLFLHANYKPELPLEQQSRWHLRWKSLREGVPRPHCSGKTAVVGHTPDVSGEIFDAGYLKCIDTYCYGGRWLTALEVATGRLWQTDQEGRVRKGA